MRECESSITNPISALRKEIDGAQLQLKAITQLLMEKTSCAPSRRCQHSQPQLRHGTRLIRAYVYMHIGLDVSKLLEN